VRDLAVARYRVPRRARGKPSLSARFTSDSTTLRGDGRDKIQRESHSACRPSSRWSHRIESERERERDLITSSEQSVVARRRLTRDVNPEPQSSAIKTAPDFLSRTFGRGEREIIRERRSVCTAVVNRALYGDDRRRRKPLPL